MGKMSSDLASSKNRYTWNFLSWEIRKHRPVHEAYMYEIVNWCRQTQSIPNLPRAFRILIAPQYLLLHKIRSMGSHDEWNSLICDSQYFGERIMTGAFLYKKKSFFLCRMHIPFLKIELEMGVSRLFGLDITQGQSPPWFYFKISPEQHGAVF